MLTKITYTIRKNDCNEFVVRFRENNERRPEWDYFTIGTTPEDRIDAEKTANEIVARSQAATAA